MPTQSSDDKMIRVTGFKGLNNRTDPVALGLEWQVTANNVLLDNAGFIVRRPGETPLLSGIKDAYATRSGRLLLLLTDDTLIEWKDNNTSTTLFSGVVGGPFAWTELGTALFVISTTHSWAIYPEKMIPWGSLCPIQTTNSYPLSDESSYPPPYGTVLASRRAQIAIGIYERSYDRSVVYFSRQGFPHEFRMARDFILVPGKINTLCEVQGSLIIGTDRAIYVDSGNGLAQKLADYGTAAGEVIYDDRGLVYLWTERGLCKALPFENMTDASLSIAPKESALLGALPYHGSTYAVIQPYGPETGRPKTTATQLLSTTTNLQGI